MQSTRCQSFCQVIRQRLWDCQQKREFCDIILETENGDQVWAHRVVISAGSFGLHTMLVNISFIEGTCPKTEDGQVAILKLPEVSLESLKDVIRFLYLGNVDKFSLESAELWKRFQICEPFRLSDEAPAEETSPRTVPSAKENVDPAPPKPAPTPSEAVVEVKQEADEDTVPPGEISSDNESLYQPDKSNKEEDTDEDKDVKTDQDSAAKRKRKCSTPKRRRIRVYSSSDDGGDRGSVDSVTVTAYSPKKKQRRSKKTPHSPKIKTEKVSEEEKFSQEEAIFSEDDVIDDDDDSYSPEEEEWKQLPKKKRGRPPKRGLKIKPVVPGKPRVVITPRRGRGRGRGRGPGRSVVRPTNTSPTVVTGPLCRTCNIPFNTREQYREHRENFHTTGHKCVECGQSFHRVNRLKAHRVEKHPKEGLPPPKWHRCKVDGCDYKSVYADGLDSHYKLVHVKDRSICELCGESFCKPYYVTLHKRRVHGDSGPTYPCEDCGTCFYIPKDLKIHRERVHMGKKRFLCDRCPYMSFDKDAVQLHMFSKHQVPLKDHRTVFTCPHCDYKTTAKSVITAHIERHGQREYKCDQCNSSFPCNRDLKGHIRRKHSDKPLALRKCPYEGCTYASKYGGPSVLQNHINRMHVNKDYKPWACEVCNYRTNVKGNLHLHLRKVHKLVPNIQQHRVQKMPGDEADGGDGVDGCTGDGGEEGGLPTTEQYTNPALHPTQQHVPHSHPPPVGSPHHSNHHHLPDLYNTTQTVPRTEPPPRVEPSPRHESLSSHQPPPPAYQDLSAESVVHTGHHVPQGGPPPMLHPGAPHSAPPGAALSPATHQGHHPPVSAHLTVPTGLPPGSGHPGHQGHPPGVAVTPQGGPPLSHPPGLQLFPGGQYGMMFPPAGQHENMFMQGLM